MFYILPVSVVFLVVSVITLSATTAVERALRMNNQSAFDEAMSKWNRRCLLTMGGYILLFIALLISAIEYSFI